MVEPRTESCFHQTRCSAAGGFGPVVAPQTTMRPSGRALPVVDSVYPLAEAAAAHERLESGEQFGKVVLRIP